MNPTAAAEAAAALQRASEHHIYEGIGEDMAGQLEFDHRLILLPDAMPGQKDPDSTERIRILWGQRLIDDLMAGRYRGLVCAVNAKDNSHGIISLLAEKLPTSQWRESMITEYARHFVQPNNVTVVKFDMDRVKVEMADLPVIHGEKLWLFQIFSNLIGNAVKHNEKPGPAVKIYYEERPDHYEFFIEDNGNGIEKHYQRRIFTIFQTLKDRDSFESTGVGLAIVKKIIETKKQHINVVSAPGKGSVFSFTWSKD